MSHTAWPGLHSTEAFRALDQLTDTVRPSAFFTALDGLNAADTERGRLAAEVDQLRTKLAAVCRSHDEWAELAGLLVNRIEEITTSATGMGSVVDRPAPCEEAGAGHPISTTP